jgi:AcrR family transcriptional regulator
MDEIALKVGIKKASLYNHFPGKEALLLEIYSRLRAVILAAPDQPEVSPSTPETALLAAVDGYLGAWSRKDIDEAWTIVSEEQYVDARASGFILEVSELYLGRTILLFRRLAGSGGLADDGLDKLAEAFAYGLRAMHLEYGLRKRHGLESGRIIEKMRDHARLFASLIGGQS